jgi:diaminopimelate epimerase
MRLSKWQALGNDYLLVERAELTEPLTPELVRRLCDHHYGVGSDGLLELVSVDGASADLCVWNPDGSTAELSGNGTRIAAAWLLRETSAPEVEIDTGQRTVKAARTTRDGIVRQELGQTLVSPDEEVDVAGERLTIVPVDIGNPHAVVLRSELSRDDLLRLGPAIETHPRFPGRTNVQFARPEPRDVVQVLVWERGAGETSASGSSAAAVAAAAVARGWCDSPVRIAMPGGELVVAIDRGSATLEGPAEQICEGTTEL